MMVAHLYIPALDSTKNQPSTLSKKIITDLLREQMGFKGLIFTDALNMQGVAAANQPGIADVKALLAGNDVMLFSENVPLAKQRRRHSENRAARANADVHLQEVPDGLG
jgi:beta-glucosidase-like glycosyl hydrolase